MAGTDASWIERFLSPILAERKGIVDAVMAGRDLPSAAGQVGLRCGGGHPRQPQGTQDRDLPRRPGGRLAVARRNGQWQVTFHYSVRGQAKQAQFGYDPDGGVQPLDADASVIGWRPPTSRRTAGAGGGPGAEKADQAPEAPQAAVAAVKPRPKAKPPGHVTSQGEGEARHPPGGCRGLGCPVGGDEGHPAHRSYARRTSFIGVGKADAPGASSKQAETSKAKGAGRPQPPQPVKRLPGVIDDRPVFARNSSSPRQQRLHDHRGQRGRLALCRRQDTGGEERRGRCTGSCRHSSARAAPSPAQAPPRRLAAGGLDSRTPTERGEGLRRTGPLSPKPRLARSASPRQAGPTGSDPCLSHPR